MSSAHKGVAKLINLEESCAIYIHCDGHVLNLAVGNCMKSSKVCKEHHHGWSIGYDRKYGF